jgi:predicted kinase
MAVLDIRGTHGSGKSWVVHQLLAAQPHVSIDEDGKQIGYHLPGIDTAVVGKYENVCGGCDQIATADEVCRRARLFHSKYRHVLLEGILVAHTFKRYSQLATELGDYVFCFLNTPLKTCIARVLARRKAKGNAKPFKPDNLIKDWHNIWDRVQRQCREAGHIVKVLDYRDPLKTVLEIIHG